MPVRGGNGNGTRAVTHRVLRDEASQMTGAVTRIVEKPAGTLPLLPSFGCRFSF